MNEWDPKTNWRQDIGTWGSPKGSNSYGDGRSIILNPSTEKHPLSGPKKKQPTSNESVTAQW